MNNTEDLSSYYEVVSDLDIKDLMDGFIDMRRNKKRPLTPLALKIRQNELNKLSSDAETQKVIIMRSIDHYWDRFYAIKKEESGGDDLFATLNQYT